MTEQWLYRPNADNSARFVLGTVGDNPLVCFGINPSTAEPNDLDPTLKTVSRIAARNGYDSWIMLNVYPQRATDPNGLHKSVDLELKTENERQIADVVGGRSLTLWAAWGSNISRRPFLLGMLNDILGMPEVAQGRWVSRGPVSVKGHPHHPSRVKGPAELVPFSIAHYR